MSRKNSAYNMFARSQNVNETTMIENMYIRILTEWSATRFKWTGLPKEINPRFLETQLFFNAFALFFKSPTYGEFMATRGAIQGPLNVYDDATKFRSIGIAAYTGEDLDDKNCVPIWASYSRVPSRDIVMLYAQRLANIDISLEINTKAMRMNKVIAAEDGQRLTWANVSRQIDEGATTIYATQNLQMSDLSVLDLGVQPSNIAALRMEKNQVWNECMTYLGITNANQDKKERLVAAEATGADGQVLAARNAEMKPRQEACERIKELFGLDITVEWDLEEDIAPTLDSEPDDKPTDKPDES